MNIGDKYKLDSKELEVLARFAAVACDGKLREVTATHQFDMDFLCDKFAAMGKALGEVIGSVSYPKEWRRLLKRKDCPQYMKNMEEINIRVYYPNISMPEVEHWATAEYPHDVL